MYSVLDWVRLPEEFSCGWFQLLYQWVAKSYDCRWDRHLAVSRSDCRRSDRVIVSLRGRYTSQPIQTTPVLPIVAGLLGSGYIHVVYMNAGTCIVREALSRRVAGSFVQRLL